MNHKCHAIDCDHDVNPRFLMCNRHWRLVLPALKRKLYNHYVKGQEARKDPTADYLEAAKACINYVKLVEDGQKQIREDNPK